MARKLKSDKLLFMAAFLLICTSVVMVYSASAMLADARYQQQYWFLMKQVTWTILGMALLLVAMRSDYRRYGEPVVIWTAVGTVGLALVAVLFSTPINGARRWLGLGGTGIQPSEAAKLAAIFFTAAVLERRMDRMDEIRYALLPVAILVGLFTILIVAEPDYGTAISLLVIVGTMVFAAGLSYRYVLGLAACGDPGPDLRPVGRTLPARAAAGIPESLGGPARRRVSDHPVARRGGRGRSHGTRPHGWRAEAVLLARASHRFHLCGHRRRARADRRGVAAAPVPGPPAPRPEGMLRRTGSCATGRPGSWRADNAIELRQAWWTY